jgi:dihydrofolate reductase
MPHQCKVVAIEHLTLDGVYQAPARTDEDGRGGFKYGGWSKGTDAPEITQATISRYMTGGWRLLAGRTTYEDLYEGWQVRQPDHPMTQALRNVQKLVASRDPGYQLTWENSILLNGDAVDAVAALTNRPGTPLIIFGSGVLVRSLLARGLVDELVLMIHPTVLGQGLRLFGDSSFTKLELVSAVTADTGAIVATYKDRRAVTVSRPA